MANSADAPDVLIVGGGAAGAVLASRLSEDSGRSVLLLEAGPREPATEAMRQAVRDARQPAVEPGLNWNVHTLVRGEHTPSCTWTYHAGKLLGGSTCVNTVQALRGMPADYAEWGQECGPEWSWAGVLPYFRALENDPVGSELLHGRSGPMPIRRETRADLTPLQAGMLKACLAQGYAEVEDHNDPAASGVGFIPKNVVDGQRMSTALTYLAKARGRPNLRILTGAQVRRVLFDGALRCQGVEADVDGQGPRRLLASQVILCAGAIHTPGILMRSGLGRPELLEPLGIPVALPLVGVGEGLMDHPSVGLWGMPRDGLGRVGEHLHQVLLRCSSGHNGHVNDLHLRVYAGISVERAWPDRTSAQPGIESAAALMVCLTRSLSRGHVRIGSASADAAPRVVLNLLGDPRDLPPLMDGVRKGWQLMQSPEIAPLYAQRFMWTDAMIASDAVLAQAIKACARPSAHLTSSARMGRHAETGAVVDPRGRVHGCERLWIGDASIMPFSPSAPTQLPTLMVAEKIAAGIRAMA